MSCTRHPITYRLQKLALSLSPIYQIFLILCSFNVRRVKLLQLHPRNCVKPLKTGGNWPTTNQFEREGSPRPRVTWHYSYLSQSFLIIHKSSDHNIHKLHLSILSQQSIFFPLQCAQHSKGCFCFKFILSLSYFRYVI